LRPRLRWLLALSGLLGAVGQVAACGEGGDASGIEQNEGGGSGSLPDASVGTGGGGGASTTVRVANLAPGLGEIDVCYRLARTGTFEGPILGGAASAPRDADADGDAGEGPDDEDLDAGEDADADAAADATSVGYRSVSRYLSLRASGSMTIAIVPAGSRSCGGALVSGDVTLDPGKLSTLAVLGQADGDAGAELGVTAYTDDRDTKEQKARVRVIHAAIGAAPTAIAVRAVAAQITLLADRVEPRRASVPSQIVPVDDLGYAEIAPVPPPTSLAIGAAGGTPADAAPEPWESAPTNLDLRGGSLHTAFVLLGDGAPFEVLWCADTSTAGDRTACTLVR
jgi:hypothetical protein